jgi:hypothetical protein
MSIGSPDISKSGKVNAPLSRARAEKRLLAGICTAVLVIAAAQGHAQPTSDTAQWFEDEAKTTSSGIAADTAKDIDKHIQPSDPGSGSILDTILDLLGLGGYFDSAPQDSTKPGGAALEHLERADDRRGADNSLREVGSGTSKNVGGPLPDVARESPQPGPMLARRQQVEDEKLATRTEAPRSWVPQFWTDFWRADLPTEDSPEMYLSELDIYAIIVLAGLAVLGFLATRRKGSQPRA